MKRSWTAYILTLVGMLFLFALARWVRINVLHEALSDEAVVLPVPVLLGAHCVAMFAATLSWRRRALYVTRLPWSAAQAAVFFVVLVVGPELAIGTFLAFTDGLAGEEEGVSGSPAAEEIQSAPEGGEGDITDEAVEAEEAPANGGSGSFDSYGRLAMPFVAAAILLLIVGVMRSHGLDAWRGFGFGRGRFWRYIGIGVVAYLAFTWAILPVLETAVRVVFNLLGVGVEEHEAIEMYRETHSPLIRTGLLVAITLTAPFFEEIIFRGVLFQTIKRYAGSAAAIVISAAIFALLHPGTYVIVNIFFLGLLFGYLFDRTGSIVPCIVLHFLFNATSTLMLVLSS